MRACADRARVFAFFASISPPAGAGAGARDGCSGVGQRRRAERAGLVRLEFYTGKLGGLIRNENKRRHHRRRTGGADRRLILLSKNKVGVTVLEADPVYVGGISRTGTYKGFHFDIGGHRFFSKSKAVEDLWTEILPNDMLERPRSSRIFYDGKFFAYPLKPFEALIKLGVVQIRRFAFLSWLKARLFPVRDPRNFEDWVSNQFGKRLFNTFFKSYTEKVWGMSCREISADWAAQRIKGLSLGSAIKNALLPQRQPKATAPK